MFFVLDSSFIKTIGDSYVNFFNGIIATFSAMISFILSNPLVFLMIIFLLLFILLAVFMS